jgi:hypothetical protein
VFRVIVDRRVCIFRVFVFKSGFPGLLVSGEPRQMRATAQKLGRVLCHILCCTLVGGFRTKSGTHFSGLS